MCERSCARTTHACVCARTDGNVQPDSMVRVALLGENGAVTSTLVRPCTIIHNELWVRWHDGQGGARADVRSSRWQALWLHVACRASHAACSTLHAVGSGARSSVPIPLAAHSHTRTTGTIERTCARAHTQRTRTHKTLTHLHAHLHTHTRLHTHTHTLSTHTLTQAHAVAPRTPTPAPPPPTVPKRHAPADSH